MAYSEVSHAVRQIAIKRNNLLNVARLVLLIRNFSKPLEPQCLVIIHSRMAVKSLVDKSAFEPIEDGDEDLCNFCIIIEHIVSHRLQSEHQINGSGTIHKVGGARVKLQNFLLKN